MAFFFQRSGFDNQDKMWIDLSPSPILIVRGISVQIFALPRKSCGLNSGLG